MPAVQIGRTRIPSPGDEDALWRYMDLSRFLSMLGSSHLYFCRGDLFEDPWEGYIPREVMGNLMNNRHPQVGEMFKQIMDGQSASSYVNCWHQNSSESAAMWKLYSHSNESVAVKTSAGRLRRSVSNCADAIFIGKVTYYNYEELLSHWSPGSVEFLMPLFSKRKSFAHETEVRAVVLNPEVQITDNRRVTPKELGKEVPVILRELIEKVYVSPMSPEWFKAVVVDVLKRYGLPDVEVIKSELYKGPVY